MNSRITIAIGAAMLIGLAGTAHAQLPDFNRVFQSVTPPGSPSQNQKAPSKQRVAAQKQRVAVQRRAPTRIIVRPVLRERLDSTEFPRSDNLGYPGRNAVRQCVSWLQPEYRLSGPVVTPQMRCRWQRG